MAPPLLLKIPWSRASWYLPSFCGVFRALAGGKIMSENALEGSKLELPICQPAVATPLTPSLQTPHFFLHAGLALPVPSMQSRPSVNICPILVFLTSYILSVVIRLFLFHPTCSFSSCLEHSFRNESYTE